MVGVDEIAATDSSLLIQALSTAAARNTMLASRATNVANVAVTTTPSTSCTQSRPPCPHRISTATRCISKSPWVRIALLLVVATLSCIQTKTNHVVHLRISSLEAARPVVLHQQLLWVDHNNNDHGQKNDHNDNQNHNDVEEKEEKEEEDDLDDDDDENEGPPTVTRRQTPVDETTLRPQRGCRSSFDPRRASSADRPLLLFTSTVRPSFRRRNPTNSELSASSLLQWRDHLQRTTGNGTLVVFVHDDNDDDDDERQQWYDAHHIATLCVEYTDDGWPRFDRMIHRMHESQQARGGGIVAFVHPGIYIEDNVAFDRLYKFLRGLQHESSLDVVETTGLYREFRRTGTRTPNWFVVAQGRMDVWGNPTMAAAGSFDFWAWNVYTPTFPLAKIPPFRYPLGSYENWWLDMMIQSSTSNGVAIIDATRVADLVRRDDNRVLDWDGSTGLYINEDLAYNTFAVTKDKTKQQQHYWSFGTPLEAPYYVDTNNKTINATLSCRANIGAISTKRSC